MNIPSFHKTYLDYLNQHPFSGNPSTLYAPMNYILSLGGKRIRPILALIGNEIAGGNINHGLEIAHAVEVFHNFSLIHDDIMDNADVRRGNPTVHVKWDMATAILSGDNMLVKVFYILSRYNGPEKDRILSNFIQVSTEVCEGQQSDMDFSSNSVMPTELAYLEMIRKKTAVLLGCSLQCGFLSGNGSVEDSQLFYDYAINLGLSFQLKDDFIDSFVDAEISGKKQGGDILEGKKTWLYLKSLEINDEETKRLFQLPNSDEKIKAILLLWKSLKLDQLMEDKIAIFDQKANDILHEINQKGYSTTLLSELSSVLTGRKN